MTGEISNEAGTAGRKVLGRRDFLTIWCDCRRRRSCWFRPG